MKNFGYSALLASTAIGIFCGGAQAQEILINQQLNSGSVVTPGSDEIDLVNGNTATSTNTSGFGAVTLQAFQSAANKLNQGFASRAAGANPGLISQTFGLDLEIDADTNNTIAAFFRQWSADCARVAGQSNRRQFCRRHTCGRDENHGCTEFQRYGRWHRYSPK
jgi:hypothetical protein